LFAIRLGGFYPLPPPSKNVIASSPLFAGSVAWQSENRTPLHSVERMSPTNQIATVLRHPTQHLAMTPPKAG